MKTTAHNFKGEDIAEISGEGILISTVQEALEMMVNQSYSGFSKIILHQQNITPEFFELKSRLAGEILQKFVNYKMKVAIVGDFKNVPSESLHAFILESNRGKQNFFVEDVETALELLTREKE